MLIAFQLKTKTKRKDNTKTIQRQYKDNTKTLHND